ncbi:MAG: PLD nuclease N-terminal domain-containing protein [Sporolactobacillus sp.]
MKIASNYLPFLIPYLVLELLLAIIALVHIFRHSNYRFGNRWLWVIIVLFFQIIGPILYLTIGRSED